MPALHHASTTATGETREASLRGAAHVSARTLRCLAADAPVFCLADMEWSEGVHDFSMTLAAKGGGPTNTNRDVYLGICARGMAPEREDESRYLSDCGYACDARGTRVADRSTSLRVETGATIRFRLDCAARTLSAAVGSRPLELVFRDLPPGPFAPAATVHRRGDRVVLGVPTEAEREQEAQMVLQAVLADVAPLTWDDELDGRSGPAG
ncbi:hypothetical protein PAPYR_11362 [Paratrimastix pyriformis]|uniref:Uncharacterized protein n=1 Tax=Paratrimastix pyriformis TaxID=342808 RepID=A0ABQ8U6G3_9EUKA|nr:hypothetical protein PAPYR_11362 [Paratrimastix pyriformis]